MLYKKICIRVPGIQTDARLILYGPDNQHQKNSGFLRPAIIICPGGGYAYVSEREAEPIALSFLSAGFNAYVLYYHCAPEAHWPIPQLELGSAILQVRKDAAETMTDIDQIFLCGFSAGAHLAASLGILWNSGIFSEPLAVSSLDLKATGMILGYPVITSGPKGHQRSFENLFGPKQTETAEFISIDKFVSRDTIPAFIWHTRDDESVSVENSLILASALAENQVPFEMHIYPHGPHGLALANALTALPEKPELIQPSCQEWVEKAIGWVMNRRYI